MAEWAPGKLAGLLREVDTTGRANFRRGLLLIAAAVEAQTKADLSRSSHTAGTPSPASRGGPPALVTGTLRRSITHQYIADSMSPMVKIGTAAGVYPPRHVSRRGKRSVATRDTAHQRSTTTPSSKYGLYQETLPRFNHPFLKPALRKVIDQRAARLWLTAFHAWPKL